MARGWLAARSATAPARRSASERDAAIHDAALTIGPSEALALAHEAVIAAQEATTAWTLAVDEIVRLRRLLRGREVNPKRAGDTRAA